jgi:endonuclease/exonuclease/phosphatase family metal-dependent hydrolase
VFIYFGFIIVGNYDMVFGILPYLGTAQSMDEASTFTHSSSKSTWQIDHIFLSEHLAKRTAARVVTTNGINEHSDHSPIELSVDGALGD